MVWFRLFHSPVLLKPSPEWELHPSSSIDLAQCNRTYTTGKWYILAILVRLNSLHWLKLNVRKESMIQKSDSVEYHCTEIHRVCCWFWLRKTNSLWAYLQFPLAMQGGKEPDKGVRVGCVIRTWQCSFCMDDTKPTKKKKIFPTKNQINMTQPKQTTFTTFVHGSGIWLVW